MEFRRVLFRAEEEARRKEQQLELQREAQEQQRREELRQALWTAAKVGFVITLIGMVLFINRGWIWPTVAVSVHRGGACQRPSAVRALAKERSAEPGSILSTAWAHAW